MSLSDGGVQATMPVAPTGMMNSGFGGFGGDVSLNGNAVNLTGAGYYDVDASLTVAPAAVGTVTVTLFKDGVAVPGATASATAAAANDALDLNITALVRQVCCAAGSALTLVLTGAAASVDNVALRVQRI